MRPNREHLQALIAMICFCMEYVLLGIHVTENNFYQVNHIHIQSRSCGRWQNATIWPWTFGGDHGTMHAIIYPSTKKIDREHVKVQIKSVNKLL